MLDWVLIDEVYLDFLRKNSEPRIPNTDYGSAAYKPFFGSLFTSGIFTYVTQVAHAQERHSTVKQDLDFFKIYDPNNPKRLISVINLNYMFPIPTDLLGQFKYSDIDKYRTFKSTNDKNNYISLLKKEISFINTLPLTDNAKKIYENKYKFPYDRVSKRSFDFLALETAGAKYATQAGTE